MAEDEDSMVVEQSSPAGFKVDLHCHILPKRWPDLKEVSGGGDL